MRAPRSLLLRILRRLIRSASKGSTGGTDQGVFRFLQSHDGVPAHPQQRPDTLIHLFVACEQLAEIPHLVQPPFCCDSLPFPSADRRCDSSSAPSGAPERRWRRVQRRSRIWVDAMCHSGRKSQRRKSASCRHRSDHSSSWPQRWRAASGDALPSPAAHAEVDDRRSSR